MCAEYLVYNKDHWVDVMIEENHPHVDKLDMDKFSTRYKRGDIIQVYEDGTCFQELAPTSPFIIIKCKEQRIDYKYQKAKIVEKTKEELDKEKIGKSEEEIYDIDTYKTINRRKYYFDMSQIDTSKIKVIEINITQFNNLIKSK